MRRRCALGPLRCIGYLRVCVRCVHTLRVCSGVSAPLAQTNTERAQNSDSLQTSTNFPSSTFLAFARSHCARNLTIAHFGQFCDPLQRRNILCRRIFSPAAQRLALCPLVLPKHATSQCLVSLYVIGTKPSQTKDTTLLVAQTAYVHKQNLPPFDTFVQMYLDAAAKVFRTKLPRLSVEEEEQYQRRAREMEMVSIGAIEQAGIFLGLPRARTLRRRRCKLCFARDLCSLWLRGTRNSHPDIHCERQLEQNLHRGRTRSSWRA